MSPALDTLRRAIEGVRPDLEALGFRMTTDLVTDLAMGALAALRVHKTQSDTLSVIDHRKKEPAP